MYLIYDGIHYDPLALTFDPSLPPDMDITVFNPKDEGKLPWLQQHKNRKQQQQQQQHKR